MKSYEELLAERDALAAQIENLRSLFPLDCLVGCEGFLNYPTKKYNNVVDAFNSTPVKCLAEIKAEAGRAGYHEALQEHSGATTSAEDYQLADQYATRVRQDEQSGTWLKDSNVNGGKRQGGKK